LRLFRIVKIEHQNGQLLQLFEAVARDVAAVVVVAACCCWCVVAVVQVVAAVVARQSAGVGAGELWLAGVMAGVKARVALRPPVASRRVYATGPLGGLLSHSRNELQLSADVTYQQLQLGPLQLGPLKT
jgi:hypothetical protein